MDFEQSTIDKVITRPKGEVFRKYGHYWNLLVHDILFSNLGFKAMEGMNRKKDLEYFFSNPDKLFDKNAECGIAISEDTLPEHLNGKIKDFDYFLKVLNTFQNHITPPSKKSSLYYKNINKNTISVILRLKGTS